jgi:hypothetical protein
VDPVDARTAYARAAQLTQSLPEQRYLNRKAGAVPALDQLPNSPQPPQKAPRGLEKEGYGESGS